MAYVDLIHSFFSCLQILLAPFFWTSSHPVGYIFFIIGLTPIANIQDSATLPSPPGERVRAWEHVL